MKLSLFSPGLPALCLAFAVTALGTTVSTPAAAVGVSTPGSACSPFGQPSTASLTSISVNQTGVGNRDASISRKVICPVVRARDGNGVVVYVDGRAAEDAAVGCTLYSYNFNGELRASKGFVAKTATFDQRLELSATEAPSYAYLSLACSLPSLERGKVLGVLTVD